MLLKYSLTTLVFFAVASSVLAAPGKLDADPSGANPVEPNLMLLIDSSGSMVAVVPDAPYTSTYVFPAALTTACQTLPSTGNKLANSSVIHLMMDSAGKAYIGEGKSGSNNDAVWDWGYGTGYGTTGKAKRCFDPAQTYWADLWATGWAATRSSCLDGNGSLPTTQVYCASSVASTYTGHFLNWYFANTINPNPASWTFTGSWTYPTNPGSNWGNLGGTSGQIATIEGFGHPLQKSRNQGARQSVTDMINNLAGFNVGLAQYNNGEGAQMLQFLNPIVGNITYPAPVAITTKQNLTNKILKIDAAGTTPLAEALQAIGRYLIEDNTSGGAIDPDNFTTVLYPDSSTIKDSNSLPPGFRQLNGIFEDMCCSGSPQPTVLNWNSLTPKPTYNNAGADDKAKNVNMAIKYWCQKNFTITLTDGMPSSDTNVRGVLQTYEKDYYGLGASTTADYLDDVSFAMHNLDLRPDLCDPKLLTEAQNFYGITGLKCADLTRTNPSKTPNASGQITVTGAATTKTVICDFNVLAAERKKPGKGAWTCNNLLTKDQQAYDYRFMNNTDNYFIGFAEPAILDTASDVYAMLHNAGEWGGRKLLTASTGVKLRDVFSEIVDDMMFVDPNSAVTLPSPASLAIDAGVDHGRSGDLYSANYRSVLWSGNLRKVDAGNGSEIWNIATGGTNLETVDFTVAANARRIFSYVSSGKGIDFTQANYNLLPTAMRQDLESSYTFATRLASTGYVVGDYVVPATANGYLYRATVAGTSGLGTPTWTTVVGNSVVDGTVTWRNMGAVVTVIGSARLNYLRGDNSNEGKALKFRSRDLALGDIIHSTPVFVPNTALTNLADLPLELRTSYADFGATTVVTERKEMLYVGANDGMLHGFDAEDSGGNEAFAYIPSFLFSNQDRQGLHYLTQPNYVHRYYVDGSPVVQDVCRDGICQASDWKTVLVAAVGAGGKGIFALDVTRGEQTGANNVLWEFTHPDLGYITSQPVIARLENDRWAVLVANGYDDDVAGDTTRRKAKLFVIYLNANVSDGWNVGTDYRVIEADVGTASGKNGLSAVTAVDVAETIPDQRIDRVYAGDLEGRLWVFDLSSSNDTQWTTAFNNNPLFITQSNQPITSRPEVLRLPEETGGTMLPATHCPPQGLAEGCPNVMVLFGTGRYLNQGDASVGAKQSYYGIWDSGRNRSLTVTNLEKQLFSTTTNTLSHTIRQVTGTPWWTVPDQQGWYVDLGAAERQIGNSLYVDFGAIEALAFSTIVPQITESCDQPNTSGWMMFLDPWSGAQASDKILEAPDAFVGAGLQLSSMPNDPTYNIVKNMVYWGQVSGGVYTPPDYDLDGLLDAVDNCPLVANVDQLDTDADTKGDLCDSDDDNDGVPDNSDMFPLDPAQAGDIDNDGLDSYVDNCPAISNSDQLNTDGDAQGDVCDSDDDNDGVSDVSDKFPFNIAASSDIDNDGFPGSWTVFCDTACQAGSGLVLDNCPATTNIDQLNTDGDLQGDVCDNDDDNDGVADTSDKFPLNTAASSDSDNDGFPGSWNASCDTTCQANSGLALDNCPTTANASQLNTDGDTQGDACDSDDDNDGVPDAGDAFPVDPAQAGDIDNDGIDGFIDNCSSIANADQLNTDGDTQGNVCDNDDDNDGVSDVSDKFPLNVAASSDSDSDGFPGSWNAACNASCQASSGLVLDNCPTTTNIDQLNTDGDTQGNVCDSDDDNDGVLDTGDAFPLQVAASVDSDGDGHPDIWNLACDIFCQQYSGLVIDFFPTNALKWLRDGRLGHSSNVDFVTTPNLSDDLLFSSDVVTAWFMDSSGQSAGTQVYGSLPDSGAAEIAAWPDTDGDGNNDLVLQSPLGGNIYYWNLVGAAQTPSLLTNTSRRVVASGDLDADGVDDLVLDNGLGGLTNYLMSAGNIVGNYWMGTYPGYRVEAMGDCDADNDDDTLLGDDNGNMVAVRIQAGQKVEATWFGQWDAPLRALVGRGDFDGDGDADLIIEANSSGEGDQAVILMQGCQKQSAIWLGAWPGYHTVGAADVDADGDDDILLNDNSTGDIALVLMETGNKQQAVWLGRLSGYVIKGIADFDGDGDADIALQSSNQDIAIIQMQDGMPVSARWLDQVPAGQDIALP